MTEGELAIYERQPEESAKAYGAFCLYRDLAPNVRSMLTAYRCLPGKEQAARVSGCWQGWSTNYDWFARVKAYDVMREQEARKIKEAEHDKALDDFRNRQLVISRSQMAASANILIKAGARLAAITDTEDIKVGQLASLFRAAAHLAEVSGKAEATALGLDELVSLLQENEET